MEAESKQTIDRAVLVEECPQVDGAEQNGSVLRTKGWNPGRTVWVSDYLSIDFGKGASQTFVAMDTVRADNDGSILLPIWPHIIPEGIYQNVPCSPSDGARIYHGEAYVAELRRKARGPR
jgi:hypothetical protein